MYIPTPESILKKAAIINPQNNDENCFLYCILIHLKHLKWNDLDKWGGWWGVKKYEKHLHELKLGDSIQMPMQLQDITKFEKLNNLYINVYGIDEEGDLNIFPLRICPDIDDNFNTVINLLAIIGEKHNHYTYIHNFKRLVSSSSETPKWFCPYCLEGFIKTYSSAKNIFKLHKENCYARTIISKYYE